MDAEFDFIMMVAILFMSGWIQNTSKDLIRAAIKSSSDIVILHGHLLISEYYNAS
jgi:hypothetical protein